MSFHKSFGIKNNFTATTNPGVSDDNTAGYSIGSLVFNTVLGLLWRCYDASTGAAVWRSADDKRATTRTVSGTTDTILESDSGGLVVYTNGAAIAVTLPDTFGVDFHFTVIQAGAGAPTVTRSGTDTINGAATGVAPAAQWKGMYLAQYAAGTYLALK